MLSHRITVLRRKAGLSQAQLADAINVSASTIGMYEQGRRIPNLETLVAIARVFHVSLDYLITGEEYQSTDNHTDSSRAPVPCPCSTCFWKEYAPKY